MSGEEACRAAVSSTLSIPRLSTGSFVALSLATVRPQTRGMGGWREERAREIRTQLSRWDEGSLWVLFLDDPHGAPLLATPIEGAMDEIDRQLAVNLAMLINEVGSKAVLLAVPRRRGTPAEADRQLWQRMRQLLADSPVELLDLLVVGSRHTWSACEALA